MTPKPDQDAGLIADNPTPGVFVEAGLTLGCAVCERSVSRDFRRGHDKACPHYRAEPLTDQEKVSLIDDIVMDEILHPTPGVGVDDGLIRDARSYALSGHFHAFVTPEFVTRLANTLDLRDRQIAGLVEALIRAFMQADSKLTREEAAARAVRSLETEETPSSLADALEQRDFFVLLRLADGQWAAVKLYPTNEDAVDAGLGWLRAGYQIMILPVSVA